MLRLLILHAFLFALAYTQSPLYYSNQNQYFLQPAALAGFGDLASDWLANTTDPAPVFSALASGAFRIGAEWLFQVGHFLALMVYFLSAWWLVARQGLSLVLFSLGMMVLHAGAMRWLSLQLIGFDLVWFFQTGLANQYLLGPGLQPSVIGVGLLTSVAAWANDRPRLAVALAAGVNLIHSTYLLPSGLLVLGYLLAEARRTGLRSAISLGALGLGIVLPVLVSILLRFPPGSEGFAEAQRILVDVRIPHHARPARWFDVIAGVQLLGIALGLVSARRWNTALPLLVATLGGLVLSLAAIASENPTLALLFPWRLTALLIPITTITFLSVLARRTPWSDTPWAHGCVAILAVGAAAAVYAGNLGYHEPTGENAAMEYVREHRQPGEVYLVPARFPKPTTSRGVFSNTFAPAPKPTAIVYFEMARFRLATGAALYIDFKSIPYRADEVLEWHRRVKRCEQWFAVPNWDTAGIAAELRAEGISHVVVPIERNITCSDWTLLFEGGTYRVYGLKK